MIRARRHKAPTVRAVGAFLCAVGLGGAAQAQDLVLGAPLDCDFETTCYVQQFVDRDPGPGVRDALCGDLANDGHKGTDFALPSRAAMEAGVAVRAAAAGIVRATRDGMADIAADAPDAPGFEGRDCGNGLVIDHGAGWQTQYCHLKRGTVAVAEGQRVARGDVLGQVGLSGATTYPHLHLSLRRDGTVVDPLAPEAETCGDLSASILDPDIPIRAAGLISAGFAAAIPDYEAVTAGDAGRDEIARDEAALVVWGFGFGVRPGDALRLVIDGPGGAVFDEVLAFDRAQARAFRAAGRRTPAGGWPAGDYAGVVTLSRGAEVLDRREVSVTLR